MDGVKSLQPSANDVLTDDVKKAIDALTDNFQKTFRDIMKSDALIQPPLESVDRKILKRYIRTNRDAKLKKEKRL